MHQLWAEPNVYLRAIPAPEAKRSGIAAFRSRILELGASPVELVWMHSAEKRIPLSAYCHLKVGRARRQILVPKDQDRRLFDAIIALGEGVTRTDRRLRYIRTYHAYELLAAAKDSDLKAIRHALSHADGTLSNPRTLSSLKGMFGTEVVDLSSRTHRRIHDLHLARMLLEIDRLVVSRLDVGMAGWIVLKRAHVRTSHVGPRLYSHKRRHTYRITGLT
jgi:hypothetical protein